jgi:stress response protein YsnF
VPVVEEEVVVDKRPVVKEEIRVRKDVVEDEQVVEEDVRKEEVDVDDQTTTRGRDRETNLDHHTGRGRQHRDPIQHARL